MKYRTAEISDSWNLRSSKIEADVNLWGQEKISTSKWKGNILNEKRAIYFMISERGIIKYLTERGGINWRKQEKESGQWN